MRNLAEPSRLCLLVPRRGRPTLPKCDGAGRCCIVRRRRRFKSSNFSNPNIECGVPGNANPRFSSSERPAAVDHINKHPKMLPVRVQESPHEERSLRRRSAGQSEPAARREAQRSRRRLRRIGPPSTPRPDGTTSRRQIDIKCSARYWASTHERQFENPGIERKKYSCSRADAPRLNSAFGESSHWRHRSRFSNLPPTIWNREAVSVRSILHLRSAIDHQGSAASNTAGLRHVQTAICAQYSGGKGFG